MYFCEQHTYDEEEEDIQELFDQSDVLQFQIKRLSVIISGKKEESFVVCGFCAALGHEIDSCTAEANYSKYLQEHYGMDSFTAANFSWRSKEINNFKQPSQPFQPLEEALKNFTQTIHQITQELQQSNKELSNELSDDFSSVADEDEETEVEKEETKEKAKEAEVVPFEEPLIYKELKPYVPPITFPSRLHKSKWNKWFSELISSHLIVNIYLPLLIVCRNMPARENFFQDLITYRRKFETLEFG